MSTTQETAFGFQNIVYGANNNQTVLSSKPILLINQPASFLAVGGNSGKGIAITFDPTNEMSDIGVYSNNLFSFIPVIQITNQGGLIFNVPPSFSGDLLMNGHNIMDAGNVEMSTMSANGSSIIVNTELDIAAGNALKTNILGATSGTVITVNDDMNASGHDILLNAINVNQGGGGGAVRVHSTTDVAVNELRAKDSGDLTSANSVNGNIVGLFRPRFYVNAITLGVVQTPLANTGTVYSLLGSWSNPTGMFFGIGSDSPVAGSSRLTYFGVSSRCVRIHCDMTYSTSAADQFEIGFYKNATISGANVISTSPIDGSFHRLNNTGLTLPRDSFHVITNVDPNDTFMIGVQCATVAGVVFQAISCCWTIEDFSNGTD